MWNDAYMNPLGFEPDKEDTKIPDAQAAEFERASRERYEYCVKMAKMFNTKHGKEVLAVWRENTIESAAWLPSLAQQATIEAANAHAYAREGQNAFVRDIENCIKIAKKCKTLEDFQNMINQEGTVNQI